MSASVIAGVVAVAVFVIIVVIILLLRYFMSHKGEYLRNLHRICKVVTMHSFNFAFFLNLLFQLASTCCLSKIQFCKIFGYWLFYYYLIMLCKELGSVFKQLFARVMRKCKTCQYLIKLVKILVLMTTFTMVG